MRNPSVLVFFYLCWEGVFRLKEDRLFNEILIWHLQMQNMKRKSAMIQLLKMIHHTIGVVTNKVYISTVKIISVN